MKNVIDALEPVLQLGVPGRRYSSFNCCHCTAFAQHEWGFVASLSVKHGAGSTTRAVGSDRVIMARCTACERETVIVAGKVVFPSLTTAPFAASDMPDDVKVDFDEARIIHHESPRGAAALLRLAIQKLCPQIGANEDDINKMIGQLVRDDVIPKRVQEALDTVRVIGNEAVHPGELDIRDDRKQSTPVS